MSDITYLVAAFGASRDIRTKPLYQYDTNVVLRIKGVPYLPDACSVYFSNTESGTATEMICSNGDVAIPNALLETGLPIYAYFYVTQGATGRTLYKAKIPVKQGIRSDGSTTPTQASAIEQAIEALNTSEANAAESAALAQEYAESAAESASTASTVAAYASQAQTYASNAEASADTASTAATTASEAAESAAEDADRAEMAAANAGFFDLSLDSDGYLIYTRTENVALNFDIDDNGYLVWEAV